MCAQLFSCPLCTRPSFQSLDSLRVGLISVATRPLKCPVCDETLLGIDKLTIHLFGHTINNASNQTTKSSLSENQLGNNKVTVPHTWNVKNSDIDIDIAPKDISNINSTNFIIENIEKTPDEIVFVNEFLHQPNFTESNDTLPIARESMPETSTVPGLFHNDTNKIVNDGKLMSVQNLNCMQSENSTGPIINSKCQEEVSHNHLSSSSAAAAAAITWTEELLFSSSVENSLKDDSTNSSTNNNFTSVVQSKTKIVPLNVDDKVQPKQLTQHIPEVCHDNTTPSTNDKSQCQATPLNDNENNNRILSHFKGLKMLTMKERTERCNVCGFHFPDHNILILHKQLVHMIDEEDANVKPEVIMKNYPCHLCPKVFKMRGSLMVHMRVAHSGYNSSKLSNEKDTDTTTCYENGFNCPTCGKNFRKEQHVTQHLKTHEGKQWGCEVCSKMFTTKYFLKKHKRLHSGEMPYKCTICNKTFTFQQSYHKHRLYHRDDKPHTCTTCGRSFKELSTLHNHERIHTGEKPFACETCGKCFRQRVSYVVHRRIHTGVMPYCCSACGKNFRYKVSQRTHKCPVQLGETGGSLSEPHPDPVSPHITEVSNTSLDTTDNPTIPISNDSLMPFELPQANKYVLIVNSDGQPLLRRESDLNTEDKMKDTNESPQVLSQNECSDILNESLETNSSEDFLSFVMPTLNTDLSSPSTKMKELRLSSPTNEENFDDESGENSNLQKDIKHAIDGILHERNNGSNSLQTINEESLKQLLYGIDEKI